MSAWDERADSGQDQEGAVRPDTDARLLVPAVGAWAAALLAGQVLPVERQVSGPTVVAHHGSGSGPGPGSSPFLVLIVCVLMVLALVPIACGVIALVRRRARPFFLTCLVTAAAVLAVLTVSCAQRLCLLHDPIVRARDGGVRTTVVLHVGSPVLASSRHGSDCQYQAVSRTVILSGVVIPSHASVWVWGSGPSCAVTKGEEVRLEGKTASPRYGQADVWLTVPAAAGVRRIRAASRFDLTVSGLWAAFLESCRGLPLQGRLLVPGMTIGVLGSQAVIGGQVAADGEEQDQADRLTSMFKTIGIVHLLAVSGGHFALVGGWVRRRLGLAGLPTWIIALGVAGADLLLASLLFPADSVSRAVAMALIGCLALAVGRPGQALSALCLTVLGLLILRPRLASSMGFALSCSAVLGILLLAGPLGHLLGRARIPRVVAGPLAATLAAQLFTLPLQMLMGPVPDWRVVPANLLTTPFVSLATILGLLSLLLCGPLPAVGAFLARAASLPTGVIVLIASWLEGL